MPVCPECGHQWGRTKKYKPPTFNLKRLYHPGGLPATDSAIEGNPNRFGYWKSKPKPLTVGAVLKTDVWRGSTVETEGGYNVIRHPNRKAVMRLKVTCG